MVYICEICMSAKRTKLYEPLTYRIRCQNIFDFLIVGWAGAMTVFHLWRHRQIHFVKVSVSVLRLRVAWFELFCLIICVSAYLAKHVFVVGAFVWLPRFCVSFFLQISLHFLKISASLALRKKPLYHPDTCWTQVGCGNSFWWPSFPIMLIIGDWAF